MSRAIDRDAALQALGLEPGAPRTTWEEAWRTARKPLLKELNRFQPGEEPRDIADALERIEAAWRLLRNLDDSEVVPAAESPQGSSVAATAPPTASSASDVTDGTETSSATAPPTVRPVLQSGTVLLDRYEVREFLSHRPEGDTYRVRDRARGGDVALKVVDAILVRDGKQRARLKQDLLRARRAHHPGIVRVLDVLDLHPTLAVVSALPAGTNLWDLVHDGAARGKGLKREEFAVIARGALDALAALHRTQTHGALRPESVWVGPDGLVGISDHGFSGVVPALRERRLSRTKAGTAYWAPEQLRDAGAEETDRGDQYSLALILYEALSGKPTVGRPARIASFRRDVPGRLRGAIERALNTSPERRFVDADAFTQAAFGELPPERTTPRATGPLAAALPAIVGVALAAGLAWSPPGTMARERVAELTGHWRSDEDGVGVVDAEMRGLRQLASRLHARREGLALDARKRLDDVVSRVTLPALDADARADARGALSELIGDVVATARDGAREARRDAEAAITALAERAALTADALRVARDEAVRAATSEDVADRFGAALAFARAEARLATYDERRIRAFAAAPAEPALREGEICLASAARARDVGDEAATTRAYEDATTSYTDAAARARAALATVVSPPEVAGETRPHPLTEAAREALLALRVEPAEVVAATPGGAPDPREVLTALRRSLIANVDGRYVVDPASGEAYGGFAIEAVAAGRSFLVAGLWQASATGPRLGVLFDDRSRVERPAWIRGTRGERPTELDLVALLGARATDERALWARRAGDTVAPPAPALRETTLVTRSGTVNVDGVWVGPSGGCVVVDGRLATRDGDAIAARVAVRGDLLSTAVRAHGFEGLASGPAAWLRLEVDGLEPRVHLLGPPDGSAVDPGQVVAVRLIAADSNLVRLTIGGEDVALRADDLVTLVEKELTAPARGRLSLPWSAVDAAGNTRSGEYVWAVR